MNLLKRVAEWARKTLPFVKNTNKHSGMPKNNLAYERTAVIKSRPLSLDA